MSCSSRFSFAHSKEPTGRPRLAGYIASCRVFEPTCRTPKKKIFVRDPLVWLLGAPVTNLKNKRGVIGTCTMELDKQPPQHLQVDQPAISFQETMSNKIEDGTSDDNELPKSLIPTIGMEFASIEEAYHFYNDYALQVGFSVRKNLDRKNKSNVVTMKCFTCNREGKSRERSPTKALPKFKRPEIRIGCNAHMKINICSKGSYKVILTDQDFAMSKAIKNVLPDTTHRLCVWHMYQNAAKHLSSVFSGSKSFKSDFSHCVYDCEDEAEFLLAWEEMLRKYDLSTNNWLANIFKIREKWALVYGRQVFCADMISTQRKYSPHTNRAYCLPCFLFSTKPNGKPGSDTFIVSGFQNWRKVSGGKDCVFLSHMGKDSNSAHNFAVSCCENFKNKMGHIETVIEKQTEKEVKEARLRLKASIDSIKWLTFQACAFRGHDESCESKNQGNFLEMIKLLASYNEEVNQVVLENAPKNAKYTSPLIQKQILHIMARKVQVAIREEIGNEKFCLIVDESRDESKKEQMAIVVRFVDKEGFIRERFLDLIHVKDTTSLTLKNAIASALSNNGLSICRIRGQGYDGATSREVHEVHNFFQNVNFVINVVSASPKRHDELQAQQAEEIIRQIDLGELDTGRGANQIGTLQRPGDTRWSSHFKAISSLLKMFDASTSVLRSIATDRSVPYASRGDAGFGVKLLLSFDFVFILHLMKDIMAITDVLCQTLQLKSLDILNAVHLLSSTKALLQELRDHGWEPLLDKVKLFCTKHEIEIPDMNKRFVDLIRSRSKKDNTTVEHHYRVDIFNVTIDQQLQEISGRFSEQSTELLTLSAGLDPRQVKSFSIENACKLAEKFYPADFTSQEKALLECQLRHYEIDMRNSPVLKDSSSLADLCHRLVESGKSAVYPLVDRLLRLTATLPVSTATTERAFSAMKLVKTALRNKMGDEFLRDYMLVYIEKEIANKITSDEIIAEFDFLGNHRSKFK
ncbi:Zinc finger MYM-type protein 1 [Carex littledalei]|uniref:Zinc finger MYM-type protein 1 n=1 Tax=Carex littledalei TaxID=544730 RepID=A0A833R9S0_9POAL|nr:Zinc finger MYM-type protein 1 [Carex littledalei]